MIFDRRSLLALDQTFTSGSSYGTVDAVAVSYDLGAPGVAVVGGQRVTLQRNMGKGGEIPLLIQVTETFVGPTSLDIILQSDNDAAFGSPKDIVSVNVLLADLVAGYILPIDKLPRGTKERYLRVKFTVNGSAATAGQITAGFVAAVDGSYQG